MVGNKRSSRLWYASLSSGADFAHKMCVQDPFTYKDKLYGHKYAQASEVRYFGALAVFSTVVADAGAEQLLQDDRFLLQGAAIKAAIAEEIAYLTDLPLAVFEFFIPLIGGEYTAVQLRSDAILCACKTRAVVYKDCLSLLDTYPMCLTQGNIPDNVDALLNKPAEDMVEPFTRQMFLALQCGFSHSGACEVLSLMSTAGCTTNMVEQAHGLGASNMESHKCHGIRSLQTRSTIHQSAPAFVDPSLDSPTLRQLERQIQHEEDTMAKRRRASDCAASRVAQARMSF